MDDSQRGDERERPVLNPLDWTKSASAEDGNPDMDRLSPGSTGDAMLADPGLEAGSQRSRDRGNPRRTSAAASSPSGLGGPALSPHSSSEPRPASAAVTPELVSLLIAALGKEIRNIVKEELHKEHENDDITESKTSSQNTAGVSAASIIPSALQSEELTDAAGNYEEPVSPTGRESTTPTQPQPSVHFSDDVGLPNASSSRTQTRKHRGSSKPEVQLSAIDHTWGVLFDANGSPTKRLEQVLRGLAKYIEESFMPGPTIVIGSDKMASFYSLYAIDKEPFPFLSIFKAHTTNDLKVHTKEVNEGIAALFSDLKIEYHLVQADLRSRPTIPALTPRGFTQWIIKNIQAYPEEEAERLAKVVSACPIEADSPLLGTPERLPKQLSRHLLPAKHDRKSRKILDEAIKDFMSDTGLSTAGSPTTESNSRSRHGTSHPPRQRRESETVSPSACTEMKSAKSSQDTSYPLRERRESTTSSRAHHTPTSPDWRHGDSHGSHDHPRRPSTTRESQSRGQESLPPTTQTRVARGSLGSVPPITTSHLQIPQSGGVRNRVPSRSRSPQTRGYRSSYPEVHNSGHRSSLSASSAAATYIPTSSGLSPTFELPTVRERDKREKNDQDYHVYTSPRVSLSSLEDAPKIVGGTRGLDRTSNAPRRLTVGDIRADQGETQESYYTREASASRGPTFADED